MLTEKQKHHVSNRNAFPNLMAWFPETEHACMLCAIPADLRCLQVVPLQQSIYFTLCSQELWRLFLFWMDCWVGQLCGQGTSPQDTVAGNGCH